MEDNPNLKSEKAKGLSIGVAWTRTFVSFVVLWLLFGTLIQAATPQYLSMTDSNVSSSNNNTPLSQITSNKLNQNSNSEAKLVKDPPTAQAFEQLPLSFETNVGQTDPQVKYLARGNNYTFFLTNEEIVFLLQPAKNNTAASPQTANNTNTPASVVRMRLVEANPALTLQGLEPLAGKSNYFIGNNSDEWHNDITLYHKVKYPNAFNKIDLILYGTQRQLEYDFVVKPDSNPALIQFGFEGIEELKLNPQGDLILKTAEGDLTQAAPQIYQEKEGMRQLVKGGYRLLSAPNGSNLPLVGFEVGEYDHNLPLIIDPTLAYSSYLGGTGYEDARGIALDNSGNVYLTGVTASTDFPLSGAFQTTRKGSRDAFVTKINPSASGSASLIYSTYLGGTGIGSGADVDNGWNIVVDSSNNAYLCGYTASSDYPLLGAYQTTNQGGYDAVVTKLNSAGNALLYSTYLGGSGSDNSFDIALDTSGNVYLSGITNSPNFPVSNAYQSTNQGGYDAFVAKINPVISGTGSLIYSTYLGSSGNEQSNGIVTDNNGNVLVAGATNGTTFPVTGSAFQSANRGGYDAIVAKLGTNISGTVTLLYASYLGGTNNDFAYGIAVDSSGNAYLTGVTFSSNFTVTTGVIQTSYGGGGSDGFVTKINPTLSGAASLVYSSFLGGSGDERGNALAVDSVNNVYLAGLTSSSNFTITSDAYQSGKQASSDAFITKLNASATGVTYSTYLGGSGTDRANGLVLDAFNNIYIIGVTNSPNLPTTSGAYQSSGDNSLNAFVTKLSFTSLVFTTNPAGALDGSVFNVQPVVKAKNLDGSIVTSFNGVVSLAIKSGSGTVGAGLGGTVTATAVNGVATFTGLSINLAGIAYILVASAVGPGSANSLPFEVVSIPTLVAPPLDLSVATTMISATSFLYSGANPVQTGVVAGTIDPVRIVVLRGKLTKVDGSALAGVKVTVLGHPEYGSTRSRAGGMYDIAVNGGGLLTLDFKLGGYISAQRQADTPWQDYVIIPDVTLLNYDPQVTPVTLGSSNLQVAQGSVISDTRGSRQATLLFPAGVTTTLKFADGSTQPLNGTINVRATEYTVGTNGPKAMPADLPPSSAYTYAADFSLDEAVAAGATDVLFSQPVVNYTPNFIGFSVGGIVPVGYYDRAKGQWIPEPNGRVVKILSINAGVASLDITGSGSGSSQTDLNNLGITLTEQQQLATLYPAGQSLWRVKLTHFSPWDYNWPGGLPPGAGGPGGPGGDTGGAGGGGGCPGSDIDCGRGTMGEMVQITGAPFDLHYRSENTPGYKRDSSIDFPLTGVVVPTATKKIRLQYDVAGNYFDLTFSQTTTNQIHTFGWDGKDSYGRTLQGTQKVKCRLGYVYDAVYLPPVEFEASFAIPNRTSGTFFEANRNAGEITVWESCDRNGELEVKYVDRKPLGLGGWTTSIQHLYDPVERAIHLGDGSVQDVKALGATINTVKPNTTAKGMTTGPDGSLYYTQDGFIKKRTKSGVETTIAGGGTTLGEGGSALQAKLYDPSDLAIGTDGSVYVVDTGSHRVRKVKPDGTIVTIAGNSAAGGYGGGNWQGGFGGDGGVATQAILSVPNGIVLGKDGSIYISDGNNNRIRRVGTNGIITTIAGTGLAGYSNDGGAATQANLSPSSIAAGVDGNLYVTDGARIRKISPDGLITTMVGNGQSGFANDGNLAIQMPFTNLYKVNTDREGNIYFVEGGSRQVRKMATNGIVTTVAGSGNVVVSSGDGGSPRQATLYFPSQLTVAVNGEVYIGETNSIRKVSPVLPNFNATDIAIPSEDGTVLYQFDAYGRHLATKNTQTGAIIYTFNYDSSGRFASVTDVYNNITTIERDGSGKPSGVVAPFNRRTNLVVDGNNELRTITDQANQSHQLSYKAGGLLEVFAEPNGATSNFSYSSLGQVSTAQRAGGGSIQLSSVSQIDTYNKVYTLTVASSAGPSGTVRYQKFPNGSELISVTDSFGVKHGVLNNPDQSMVITAPDGIVGSYKFGADPRWQMQAPILSSIIITRPNGQVDSIGYSRTVNLSNPANLLSVQSISATMTVNGQQTTAFYERASGVISTTSGQGRLTTVRLDDNGRPLEVSVPGIDHLFYTYDVFGRVASYSLGSGANAHTVVYHYNPTTGLLDSVTDPLSRTVSYSLDAIGRANTVSLPGGRTINLGYDLNSNLNSITPPGKTAYSIDYNALSLPVTQTMPTVPGGGLIRRWQLITKTNNRPVLPILTVAKSGMVMIVGVG